MARAPIFCMALTTLGVMTLVVSQARAGAGDTGMVGILVLKEHGVGTPTLAQPYLDRFVAITARQNDWPAAKGQYHATRSGAEAFIEAQKPHYGILSLAAFLAFRVKYHLDVIGEVVVSLVGGQQYHLVSKRAADWGGCKGKTLASDHLDDVRFIDRVVAGGKFRLSDFTLVPTQRPLQTIKKVIAGDAECALIDEAQMAELAHLEGAEAVHSVWKSNELPPMAVVAFPNAPAAERKVFRENFDKLCDDDAQSACAEVGILSLKVAGAADYASVVAAYGN